MILLANGKVITRDSEGAGYLPDGGVVTNGGKIVEVGKTSELKAKYPQAEFVDAKGGVIMPGLINAHTHIYSALARRLAIVGNNPTNFYEVLDGTWWAIDRNLDLEATRASASSSGNIRFIFITSCNFRQKKKKKGSLYLAIYTKRARNFFSFPACILASHPLQYKYKQRMIAAT